MIRCNMRLGLALIVVLISCTVPAATITGGPFTVEYARGEEALAQRTLVVLEAALAEFAGRLPSGDAPIHVVVCATMQGFRRHAGRMGTRPVEGIARSAEGVIVVKAPGLRREAFDYEGTLRHELVHVLVARNANMAAVPRWLNEGIAMTVGKDFRWESMFRVARMYLQGRLIAYPELDFAFVAPETDLQFGDAYAQALSMTRFLRDRIGEETFWELVYAMRTEPFGAALRAKAGLTPLELYEEWRRTLWKVALISSLVSGFSVFQLMAVLVIVAYWRKRRRGKRLLMQWEKEEAEEDAIMFPWQLEGTEPPYPWEESDEEE